ncbi:MAG: hypothetical protein J5686_04185 [Bacteroidales bacterium]|nr:hypothetical protein [Bacteroidales bacterium]
MKKFCLYLIFISIVLFVSCNRPRIVVENDDTEGFDIVKVYRGDTVCPIIWQGNTAVVDSTGNPREGRFFYYHEKDSIIKRFICCDKTYAGEIIGGHIDDYISDSTFLIVDQKPVDMIFGTHYYDGKYHSTREYDTTGNMWKRKTILDLSKIHQYWIVNKKTHDVYGPFSYEDYLDMKKKLDISQSLMLKWEILMQKYDKKITK